MFYSDIFEPKINPSTNHSKQSMFSLKQKLTQPNQVVQTQNTVQNQGDQLETRGKEIPLPHCWQQHEKNWNQFTNFRKKNQKSQITSNDNESTPYIWIIHHIKKNTNAFTGTDPEHSRFERRQIPLQPT